VKTSSGVPITVDNQSAIALAKRIDGIDARAILTSDISTFKRQSRKGLWR
jgi:hypothetical protein